ncbi:hypothetical protein LZ30DRAFT_777197 [Colletotrichum cereale]|nr:hypothetical protein LZ30DRAFT_777197 [Colletotrichum cereale]
MPALTYPPPQLIFDSQQPEYMIMGPNPHNWLSWSQDGQSDFDERLKLFDSYDGVPFPYMSYLDRPWSFSPTGNHHDSDYYGTPSRRASSDNWIFVPQADVGWVASPLTSDYPTSMLGGVFSEPATHESLHFSGIQEQSCNKPVSQTLPEGTFSGLTIKAMLM